MKNAYLTLPSPFPVEHRLVYIWPVLRWPRYDQDQDAIGPELSRAIDLILSRHPDKRGLIHSVSYKRTELLLRHCLSQRLLEYDRSEPFDHAIKRLASTPGGVLVSPRATEGIDLKNDHSELQVFLKLPFKLLGDDRVKKRKETDQDWYALMTAIAIVQGSGRSIRTLSDVAPTYILDAAWPYWFRVNGHFFPRYFRDAIRPFSPPQPTS
jgi:ATP-dependent DNA helicase DinG